MKFFCTLAALFTATQVYAIAPQAPMPPQAPPVQVKQVCECCAGGVCVCDVCQCECKIQAAATGWTELGNGYQRHASGYYYHPAHGVYWPQPVQAAPIFQSIDFGGFAGACPPSG